VTQAKMMGRFIRSC